MELLVAEVAGLDVRKDEVVAACGPLTVLGVDAKRSAPLSDLQAGVLGVGGLVDCGVPDRRG